MNGEPSIGKGQRTVYQVIACDVLQLTLETLDQTLMVADQ